MYKTAKRLLDILVSIVGLAVLAPVFAVIALAILVDSGLPVFFVQQRVGLGGRLFGMFKFRTMVPDAESKGLRLAAAEDDPRLTRVGRFLRNTSMDELPQAANVFLGDMSFIGPRPTLAHQVAQYTPYQRRRHEVRPGITGWAQVNGRNTLTWPERIDLDVWYVDHLSLPLDLLVLARSPLAVLDPHGVYGATGVTQDFEAVEEVAS